MGKETSIEYVNASWNPWYGCTPVSPGCQNCYAKRNWRLLGLKPGEVRRAKDATFYAPLKWEEPRRIIVCSISDFFHEAADAWREEALDVMSNLTQQHTFIIPTKRTERIIECLYGNTKSGWIMGGYFGSGDWMPNWWFLASVENQEQADKRIPELLKLREYGEWPVLGLSIEPMLGAIDLRKYLYQKGNVKIIRGAWVETTNQGLDLIICGEEHAKHPRLCTLDDISSLRDQCVEADISFFLKQLNIGGKLVKMPEIDGRVWNQFPEGR